MRAIVMLPPEAGKIPHEIMIPVDTMRVTPSYVE